MATKIVTKNSSTASAVPTASDLVQGELAVNVADKRLFTEDNAGAIVELGTNPSGNVTFQDNGKAIFGAGSDLQVYHDGSNSYIDEAGQGTLYVRADSATTIANPSNTLSARFRPSTSVSLYYNGVEKLATTATGIDVTGNVTMATGGSIVAGGANDLILNAGESGTPDIYLQSGGSTKVKVEGSNGNVGIGLTAPDAPLSVYSPSASANIKLTRAGTSENLQLGTYYINSTNNDLQLATTTSHPMVFKTNNLERMRIDSSGNLLVGQTVGEVIGVGNTTEGISLGANGRIFASYNGQSAYLNRNGTDGALLGFYRAGTSVGSIGTTGGNLQFMSGSVGVGVGGDNLYPTNGSGNSTDASLDIGDASARFKDLYLSGTANVGSEVVLADSGTAKFAIGNSGNDFYIYSNAAATERMRINASGRQAYNGSATANGHGNFVGEVGASYKALMFEHTVGGGETGSIVTTSSSTSYNTSSDYRLKENVVELTGATERLKQLNPSRFNFIVDADTTVDGFLAHEVQDVVPEAITGTKDAMKDEEYEVTPAVLDDDGNVVTEAVMGTRSVPDYQGIDQSKLVPLLVATIQELEARITQLENN